MVRKLALVALVTHYLLSVTAVGTAEVIHRGAPSCKGIAFTFDLCPVRKGRGYDQELIELLKEKEIHATFFLSGRWMAGRDADVRALMSVPFFEVGTHGSRHAHLPLLSEEDQRREMEDAVTLLRTRYGSGAPLFRPPYGEYNESTAKIADALGLRVILWNIVSGDPDPLLSERQIVTAVQDRARNGSIVVFHANGKGKYTREAVQDLYAELLVHRGLRSMTVTELLACAQQTAR
jgi:peptidoglycan-N-acetylglucosamine deacetylase